MDQPLPPAPEHRPPIASATVAADDLSTLLPGGQAGIIAPLVLAGMRSSAAAWLGSDRLARIAADAAATPRAMAKALDAVPPLPNGLTEQRAWSGRRIPILAPASSTATDAEIIWLDLWWKADQRGRRPRERGSFASRLTLPSWGRVEIRGRMEEDRMDALLDCDATLPPALADLITEAFTGVVRLLGLHGVLTIRHPEGDRKT